MLLLANSKSPPGTGKTFLGALVARTIRENTNESILCVCHTNHALDQFLEHMLDAGEQRIVRIGGRSKSNRLEKYNLKILARRENNTDGTCQRRIKQVHAQLFKLKDRIGDKLAVFKGELKWRRFREYLTREHPEYFQCLKFTAEDGDDFRLVGAGGKDMKDDFLWKCWLKGEPFPAWMSPLVSIDGDMDVILEEFWSLSVHERSALAERWRQDILEIDALEMADLVQEFGYLAEENETLCRDGYLEILRNARVIGATTSGAATYRDILSANGAGILIVEEAGEVLEAHILTALSESSADLPSTKHVILIGDHLQLPPKVENYQLTTTSGAGYNLDISLFERLIRSGRKSVTLAVQHRMRPSISALVRAQTYPDLKDHYSVGNYPDVRGVSENVLFIDHSHLEDGLDADDTTTKSNMHEAELSVEIVRFLMLQGYGCNDLVILTPYLGQLLTIMRLVRSNLKEVTALVSDRDMEDLGDLVPDRETNAQQRASPHGQSVRCSSIDNYQGEEADVVVISCKYLDVL